MSLTVIFRPEAEQELLEAHAWYEAQQLGLGDAFIDRVEAGLEHIVAFPKSCPLVHDDVRRYLLERFPHSILYLVEPEQIVVLAVYHGRRDPGGWTSRG